MPKVDLKILQQSIDMLEANNAAWLDLAARPMRTDTRTRMREEIEKRNDELVDLLKRKWVLEKSGKENK
jgi:hypothetical protein